jgi:hypothetical protein
MGIMGARDVTVVRDIFGMEFNVKLTVQTYKIRLDKQGLKLADARMGSSGKTDSVGNSSTVRP